MPLLVGVRKKSLDVALVITLRYKAVCPCNRARKVQDKVKTTSPKVHLVALAMPGLGLKRSVVLSVPCILVLALLHDKGKTTQ